MLRRSAVQHFTVTSVTGLFDHLAICPTICTLAMISGHFQGNFDVDVDLTNVDLSPSSDLVCDLWPYFQLNWALTGVFVFQESLASCGSTSE